MFDGSESRKQMMEKMFSNVHTNETIKDSKTVENIVHSLRVLEKCQSIDVRAQLKYNLGSTVGYELDLTKNYWIFKGDTQSKPMALALSIIQKHPNISFEMFGSALYTQDHAFYIKTYGNGDFDYLFADQTTKEAATISAWTENMVQGRNRTDVSNMRKLKTWGGTYFVCTKYGSEILSNSGLRHTGWNNADTNVSLIKDLFKFHKPEHGDIGNIPDILDEICDNICWL